MAVRFDPSKPFYAWTVEGGFQFFDTRDARDAAVAAMPANQLTQIGTLPAHEVGVVTRQPDPHNLLDAPVAVSIPGPVFAALWRCSGQNDIRWYLSGCVMLHGTDAYATDGRALVRKTDAAFGPSTEGLRRVLVHLDAWAIPLLTPKTVVEVLDTGFVRVTRRRKRGDEVVAMGSQLARGLEFDTEPLPAPWEAIETTFANMFNGATVEGLITPVSHELLSRAIATAGSLGSPDAVIFRSHPEANKAVAWVSTQGCAGLIMPMTLSAHGRAHCFEKYGLKAPEPVTPEDLADADGEV